MERSAFHYYIWDYSSGRIYAVSLTVVEKEKERKREDYFLLHVVFSYQLRGKEEKYLRCLHIHSKVITP